MERFTQQKLQWGPESNFVNFFLPSLCHIALSLISLLRETGPLCLSATGEFPCICQIWILLIPDSLASSLPRTQLDVRWQQ